MGPRRALALIGCLLSCRQLSLPEAAAPQPGTVQALVVYARPGQTELQPAVGAHARLQGTALEAVADNSEGRVALSGVVSSTGTLHFTFDADGDGAVDHQRLFSLAATGAGPGRDVFLGIIVLGRNAQITGKALKADRAGAPGGHGGISVFVPEAPFVTQTGDDGTYVLRGLPEGEQTVAAFSDQYAPFAQRVNLRAGEDLRLADIVLDRAPAMGATGELHGSTVLASGAAATGVSVTAAHGSDAPQTTTDSSGAFTFSTLQTGLWSVRFEKSGFKTLDVPNVLVIAGANTLAPVTLQAGSGGAGGGSGGGSGGSAGGTSGGGSGGSGGAGGGGVPGLFSVHVYNRLLGGTSGEIEWLDGGSVCGRGSIGCTLEVDAGTRLSVRGHPTHPWSRLVDWVAPCESGAPYGFCDVTVDEQDLALEANFDRPNLVFVSDERRVPAAVALEGEPSLVLNRWCNALATDAGLPGPFVALVGYQSPDGGSYQVLDTLATSRGWMRPDGLTVFDTITALGEPFALPNMTQLGVVPSSAFSVFTGYDDTNLVASCAGLTSTASVTQPGNLSLGGARWLRDGTTASPGCGAPMRFYCFGTGRSVPMLRDPFTPTRLAFVTPAAVKFRSGPDAGLDAADTFCQSYADLRGFTGTYKALLPSLSLTAAQRAAPPGPPWAREDGTVIATRADLNLALGRLLAPFENTQGNNLLVNDVAYTGAPGPGATTSANCEDWVNPAPFTFEGVPFSTQADWFNHGGAPGCSDGRRLYCLQQ
ncbi:MAG: carboxypeptidase regulatory-like domain-containing protein [Archangiaceae bacterium]|nr:carboxypeptidase regulatory-like domain-containing protein [Archangiaceae bacterium]